MTRTEAHAVLDEQAAAIRRNVDDFAERRITVEVFHERQNTAHRKIDAAGMRDEWSRLWRAGVAS